MENAFLVLQKREQKFGKRYRCKNTSISRVQAHFRTG